MPCSTAVTSSAFIMYLYFNVRKWLVRTCFGNSVIGFLVKEEIPELDVPT
jgi:hypothetical protein